MRVIVPVKDRHQAKTRMASVFSEAERAELSLAMARDVFGALTAVTAVSSVTILTKDEAVLDLAAQFGFETCCDGEDGGLNSALEALVDSFGVVPDSVLIMPHDLPAVTATDLDTLADTYSGGVLICPSAEDAGTNGLVFSLPRPIGFHYGRHSFIKHLKACADNNVPWNVFRLPGLARDMDTVADLAWLIEMGLNCATRDFLAQSNVVARSAGSSWMVRS